MRLSKTGLRVLTQQYRSVLKKCFLINAGLFLISSTAMAADITVTDGATEDYTNQNTTVATITVKENSTLNVTNSNIDMGETGVVTVEDSKLNLTGSSIDLSTSKNIYTANATFKNADVTMTNSEMPVDGDVKMIGGTWKQSYDNGITSDYQVEVKNLNVSGTTITLDDKRADTESTLSAKETLNITNKSEVTLNNNAVLAWNGQVYDKNDKVVGIKGSVNIDDSTVTLNDASKLLIGMDDDEGADNNQAKLNISNSKITLNDDSAIEFHLKNKENTTITKTKVHLWDNSKLALNDLTMDQANITAKGTSHLSLDNLTMVKSHIELNDNSTLDVKDVSFDKGSSINGKNNKVKFSGDVDFGGFFDPAIADVEGNLTRDGYDDEITYNLNSGVLKYESDKYLYDESKHTHNVNEERTKEEVIATINGENIIRKTFADGNYALNSVNFNGGLLDIANGEVTGIKLSKLSLSKEANIHVDADLANKTMDTLTADTIEANAKLNIAKLNLISDATEETTTINFTKDADLLAQVNYTGATSGLTALSPVYNYDVAYDNATGDFTFTRGGGAATTDYNPAVYGSATTSQTVGFLQQNIANAVFDNLGLQTFKPMGRASGDEPYSNHAWVSLFGADDNVEFDSFETVDSEMMSLAGGFNSDKIKLGDNYVGYGIYAGYLNGEGKYTGNEIDQEGGYIGLSSSLQNGNFVMAGTINGGFIKNEAKHSFGTDKYDTYWTGVSLKTGYDYHVNNSLTIQPNVYAGYSFVNSEDYTSKSGAKIKNDNLHLFEVAPGLKVNQTFANGWNGFAQAKYAFVMDNGGDTNVDTVVLPNISVKDYVEYGLGVEKDIRSDWSLAATINRRDGGRQGWNGSLTVKYNF